ncbi:hypothetical protein CURE108131_20950 [Cupriavidus respiraculi]|uniref:Uncharacterized protein n=1 Tax=Cupriavidus respiraculi TaxID=195930 RepID=A0ABN7YI31_9BURK|nr:hypothetical protein [Cupriavidus respiraculi]CAG9173134.1 hypothetical protein LMG21510_02164 [Cupriavidus respiraculi]
MSDAVFADTRQALLIAYMVSALEPRQPAPFRKALIRAMEAQEHLTGQQEAWLAQLRGTPAESTVNFGGLTSDEVRAQCSAVISAVNSKLPAPEQWVVRARFIPTEHEDVGAHGSRTKRYFYSRDRLEAIRQLARWLPEGLCPVTGLALDMLTARVFADGEKLAISFRDMATAFGGNHMTYARAYPKLRARLIELEKVAVGRLTPYFERTGLIEAEESVA